jgi:putative glutamine amidotransferase
LRPIIGITSNLRIKEEQDSPNNAHTLRTKYAEMILAAGGATVILPLATEEVEPETLARVDGLVLSGGGDIPPECFGASPHLRCHYMPPERWRSDCLWLETAEMLQTPVLGICLGMQVMNVAAGGTLIQDLPSERPGARPHTGPGIGCQHEVRIEPGSRLAAMAPSSLVMITSSHHQAVDQLGKNYRAVAAAEDGMIEAIETVGEGLLLGVQWHPERCLDQPNWLLQGFVEWCRRRSRWRSSRGMHYGD